MITDIRKIDSSVEIVQLMIPLLKDSSGKKLNSPVDISESDELILVYTSFFRNCLKETIFVVLVLKNVLVL